MPDANISVASNLADNSDTPTFRSLLGPNDLGDFRARIHAKMPLLVRGARGKYADLFSWSSLTDVLNLGVGPSSSLKLNLDGRFIPVDNHREVHAALKQGATLIVENVDRLDKNLARFLDRLSGETHTPTRFNLYASPTGKQGYKIHYDTHDVFVLQIEGQKDWFVFPSTIEQPLYFQKRHSVTPPPLDKPELTCTLKKGDLLYIPKGHWHYAVASSEPSLHLTLGFFIRTGIDLLAWIVDELRDTVSVRAELPLRLGTGLTGLPEQRAAFDDAIPPLVDAVTSVLTDPTLAERFWKHGLVSAKNRQPYSLPSQIVTLPAGEAPEHFVRHPHPYSLDRTSEGNSVLTVCGQSYEISEVIAGAVSLIFSRDIVSKMDLLSAAPALEWEAIWPIVRELMQDGVLRELPFSGTPDA
ncbi:MAG: hypothetical protein HOP18_09400 [Deltaproteobacteria bacterium]|nr:hypothetical protein [Deltaproteobacteria bacterium]